MCKNNLKSTISSDRRLYIIYDFALHYRDCNFTAEVTIKSKHLVEETTTTQKLTTKQDEPGETTSTANIFLGHLYIYEIFIYIYICIIVPLSL